MILGYYEKLRFTIHSNPIDIESYKEDYEFIKKYLNKEITFEYLMLNVNNCPLNACEWCNHNCNKCDLKKIETDISNRCELCWKRCLEIVS